MSKASPFSSKLLIYFPSLSFLQVFFQKISQFFPQIVTQRDPLKNLTKEENASDIDLKWRTQMQKGNKKEKKNKPNQKGVATEKAQNTNFQNKPKLT